MRNIFFLSLIIISISSCRKDVGIPEGINYGGTVTPNVPFVPLTVGSFWVYRYLNIDAVGNETTTGVDTVRVLKDSIINGNTYAYLTGSYLFDCPSCYSLVRDSLGNLVVPNGKIIFSSTNFTDTLFTNIDTSWVSWYGKMAHKDSSVTVPAGTFITSEIQETYYFPPSYSFGNPRYAGTLYSQGVGVIKNHDFYTASSTKLETRLLSYYIAP